MEPRQLLERLKEGGSLTVAEGDQVAAALTDPSSGQDRYTLIHILGRAERTDYRNLIERFLDEPTDPMLARIALTVLCRWWAMTDNYLLLLLAIGRGVPWDIDQEVRQVAIAILGEHSRVEGSRVLLAEILRIADDTQEWDLIREDAVRSLAVALGDNHIDLPPASRREPVDSPWSSSVLARARARVQAEG